jgi:DNA-binding NarL/FixJ family response regulator
MVAGQVTPKRKETAFRRGRVLELRLMGETHPEIADELGIRLFTVKDDLRLTDNLVRDSKLRKALGEVLLKGWTSPGNVDERRGRVLALVREGKTPLEIAGELGVSQPTVSRDLRALKYLEQKK